MKLTVAGTQKEFRDGLTLRELVEEEKVETPEYVTVSVNDDLYGAADFDQTVLSDGAVVEFLYFMGGGGNIGIYE